MNTTKTVVINAIIYLKDNKINQMDNAKNKPATNVVVVESRLSGLKKHSEELNRVVIESLQNALFMLMKQKEYSKITITELCQKAGVSRSAFYDNFRTKNDIVKKTADEFNHKIVEVLGSPFRSTTDERWYINLFKFVKENLELIKPMFDAGMQTNYLKLLNAMILHDDQIETDVKYQRLIWIGGMENAIDYWVKNGMIETAEEMGRICQRNLVAK